MVKYSKAQLDDQKSENKDNLSLVFHALSDPTRRRMLEMLQNQELTLTQLCEPFDMTMAAVMKHMKVLGAAGLIENHKTGRVRHCRMEEGPIVDATVWLSKQSKYWQAQFEILATFLQTPMNQIFPEGEKHELRSEERTNPKTAGASERAQKKGDRPQKKPATRKGRKL